MQNLKAILLVKYTELDSEHWFRIWYRLHQKSEKRRLQYWGMFLHLIPVNTTGLILPSHSVATIENVSSV